MENDNLNDPEIDRVIHFLEYEINSRRSEATRPGWTTWAILGAIASLLWLMFSVLDINESISWFNIFYITFLLSISLDFFFLLNAFLSSVGFKKFERAGRFKQFDNYMGSYLALLFLRTGVLLIFVHWISQKLNIFVEFFCWSFLVINLIQTLILLVLFYFQIPTPTSPNPKFKVFSYLWHIIWLAFGGIATIGLIGIIYSKALVPLIPEWRIGFIIFSLSLLILILFRSKAIPILLLQLDDIRRKLSLGKLHLNRAKQQIDLVMHGLALSDILQSKINDVLVSFYTVQNIYEKYNSELKIIEKFIDTPSEKLNKEENITLNAILNSSLNRQNEIKSETQTLSKNKAKLSRRIGFFYGMSKDIAPDIEKLMKEINEETNKLNNVTEKAFDRLKKLKDKRDKQINTIAQQPHSPVLSQTIDSDAKRY